MTMDAKCCESVRVTKIKVEEHGRKAVFLNEEKLEHIKIRVDGCVIKNSTSADWVVARESYGDVIIELKGKDVDTAVKQVEATASHWRSQNYGTGKIAALIVSTQYPKANTAVRKAQEKFTKVFHGPLHVVTKNYEGCLEAVFSFKGPHKI